MDITKISMELSNVSLQSKVSVNVLDQTLEANKEFGQGIVQMIDASAMERSVNSAIGGNFDLSL